MLSRGRTCCFLYAPPEEEILLLLGLSNLEKWKVIYSQLLSQWHCQLIFTHFPDDIFKCIFLNENVWISIKISLKVVPKVQINNIPTLVQIMAWCRPGDKPLSEPMMVSLCPNQLIQSGNKHKPDCLAQTSNSSGHLKWVCPPTITLAYLLPENICQCDHRWILKLISDACWSLLCLMN